MSALANYPLKALPQPQRTIAFGSVGSNYVLVGSLFEAGICMLALRSTFNAEVTISLDGVNDWLTLANAERFVYNAKSNGAIIPGNYGIYVKGTVASGNLSVTTMTVDL